MKAFDESRQPTKGWVARAALGLAVAAAALPALAQDDSEGVELLARADAMRDQALALPSARQRAADLVGSLELVKRAFGRVYEPGGAVAALDYDARRAEAADAIRAAGDPPALARRLERLTPTTRGAAEGRIEKIAQQSGRVALTLRFEGGKPAIIYARTQFPTTLHLTVRDAAGKPVCDQARASGRVLCRWLPVRMQSIVVAATALDPVAAGTLRVFTN